MQFNSRIYRAPDFAAAQELLHSRGWTDGLPVVPATTEAVKACLTRAGMAPDQLIGIEPVRSRPVTAEKVAINAVMAGCLPSHFPVVVATIVATLQEPFLLHGVVASTSGAGVLIIVNGPIRNEIGASGTFDVLGVADRATTVIGRALRLVLINVLDMRPGGIDRSTLGHPGKISFCLAEDEEGTGWLPLAETRGIPNGLSAITVFAAGAPRQIMNEWTTSPEEILETFAAEMRANQLTYSIYPGNYVIIIPRQLREHLEAAGWSKADVAAYLFERARVKRSEWRHVGKQAIVGDRGEAVYPALTSPEHLLIIAAGGPAGGFGAVIPPQRGDKSKAVTLSIDVCLDCSPDVATV